MQEINVDGVVERGGLPVQIVAALQHRPVKSLAVEGHQNGKAREKPAELVEKRALVTGSIEKVLAHHEALTIHIPQTHQEDIGAGPHAEPSRLGVEEYSVPQVGI